MGTLVLRLIPFLINTLWESMAVNRIFGIARLDAKTYPIWRPFVSFQAALPAHPYRIGYALMVDRSSD